MGRAFSSSMSLDAQIGVLSDISCRELLSVRKELKVRPGFSTLR